MPSNTYSVNCYEEFKSNTENVVYINLHMFLEQSRIGVEFEIVCSNFRIFCEHGAKFVPYMSRSYLEVKGHKHVLTEFIVLVYSDLHWLNLKGLGNLTIIFQSFGIRL